MKRKKEIVVIERIEGLINEVRGEKIILDVNLAKLYGVTTHRLNEQARRNIGRFPEDFLFKPTNQEVTVLRSQNAISNRGQGGLRYAPLHSGSKPWLIRAERLEILKQNP